MKNYEKPAMKVETLSVDVCTTSTPDPMGAKSLDQDVRSYWGDTV